MNLSVLLFEFFGPAILGWIKSYRFGGRTHPFLYLQLPSNERQLRHRLLGAGDFCKKTTNLTKTTVSKKKHIASKHAELGVAMSLRGGDIKRQHWRGSPQHSESVQAPRPGYPGLILSSSTRFFQRNYSRKNSRDSMTAPLLRCWTVPRINVVIKTHPVLVRAVLQKRQLCHVPG